MSDARSFAKQAFAHLANDRVDEAVAAYRAALYLDPSLFQVRVLLADALMRLGDRSRAEHQFREVLTLLGSGRERVLKIFESLPLPDRERARRRSRQVLNG